MRRVRRTSVGSKVGCGVALAIALAACGGSGAVAPGEPTRAVARATLPRELTGAERSVLSAANAFSFGLWKTISQAQRDSNVFVSPLSVSFALGMTMTGAAGQTYDEMRSALRFGDGTSLAAIDSGYSSLIALLTGLDPSTTMQIANAIFYRTGFPFNQSFLNDAATFFQAEVKSQNFADAAGTVAAINGWVDTKTHGRIPSVLDHVGDEVMFLINAIYFKGSWRDRFDPAATVDAPFHPSAGSDQPAKLMHRQAKMAYAETDTYQAVDLAYGDSSFTMTVLLPKTGTSVETLAASLTPESWRTLSSSFQPREVNLFFPRVTFSWKRPLIADMQAQGMRAAFVPDGADFTRMSPQGTRLFISSLQQNTFVAIDEVGTEAAAVTVVGVTPTSLPIIPTMRVDRPYLVVIRERLSGTVLFMGKIVRLP